MEMTMTAAKKTALAFFRVVFSFVIVVVFYVATVCFVLVFVARSSPPDILDVVQPD
jgi:hypothetical protein